MTSTIKTSVYQRNWAPPEKPENVTYYHDVEMVNGDKGSYGAKSQNPPELAAGQTITDYVLAPGKREGTMNFTFPNRKPFSGGGKPFQKEPFEERAIGFAYSYSKDLTVAGKLEPGKKMIETANSILDAMIASKNRVAK